MSEGCRKLWGQNALVFTYKVKDFYGHEGYTYNYTIKDVKDTVAPTLYIVDSYDVDRIEEIKDQLRSQDYKYIVPTKYGLDGVEITLPAVYAEDSATTNLDSYAVNISTPQTAYAGNAVFDYVDNLRQNRAVGADAQAEVLLVYAYAKDGENTYKAERNNAVLQIDDFGGEGGGSVVLNYTVNLNGNPILGTATVEGGTVTFTAE